MVRNYSKSASDNVRRVMKKRKAGALKSGSGKKVKSRKQAIAIALSESRRAGKKVPKAPTRKSAKTKSAKTTSARKGTGKKVAKKKSIRTVAKKTAKKTRKKATKSKTSRRTTKG